MRMGMGHMYTRDVWKGLYNSMWMDRMDAYQA